jgi:MftR C-terminal domain
MKIVMLGHSNAGKTTYMSLMYEAMQEGVGGFVVSADSQEDHDPRSKEDLALSGLSEQGELIAARLAERPAEEDAWTSLRAAFQVLEEIDMTAEGRLEFITLVFGNESLRAGHAEKQARWQDLFAPLIEPRLPDSDRRTLQARAIAAAAITCLQAANEEWVRLGGQVDLFDLYDTAVHAIRRPA